MVKKGKPTDKPSKLSNIAASKFTDLVVPINAKQFKVN